MIFVDCWSIDVKTLKNQAFFFGSAYYTGSCSPAAVIIKFNVTGLTATHPLFAYLNSRVKLCNSSKEICSVLLILILSLPWTGVLHTVEWQMQSLFNKWETSECMKPFREKSGMKVTHHTLQTSGRMSVNCHGSVPSTVVATVTWHVVGLHGGEQKACPLAVSGLRLGESFGSVKARGGQQSTCTERSPLISGGLVHNGRELRSQSWRRKVTRSEMEEV